MFVCFLYGCKTWCLTVRREHRLRLFEGSVLREILGLRGHVTGYRKQLPYDLCCWSRNVGVLRQGDVMG